MTEGITTAQATENGESTFAVDIQVSGYTLKGDEPVAAGGKGLGPSPYDLLTASLCECTAMTVRWYAARQKWPLTKVEVTVMHRKAPGDVFEKTVTLHGAELTEEQRAKLHDVAAKCPVQRTLESDVVIHTKPA